MVIVILFPPLLGTQAWGRSASAAVSKTNESTVRQFFPRLTIRENADELYGYRHAKSSVVGTAVHYGSRTLPAFTLQVCWQDGNFLGFDLFCALGFFITDNMCAAILIMSMPWQHRYPSLFVGLAPPLATHHPGCTPRHSTFTPAPPRPTRRNPFY